MKIARCLFSPFYLVGASLFAGAWFAQADEPIASPANWPQEPNRYLLQPNVSREEGAGPYVAPRFQELIEDPLDAVTLGQKMRGSLVYAPYLPPFPGHGIRLFFTLRKFGVPGESARGAVANYSGSGLVSDPMFSPDGRAISYKAGDTSYHGLWDAYVWNFDERTVVQISDHGVGFPILTWSPGSTHLAYASNGLQVGEEDVAPFQLKVTDVKNGKSQNITAHLALSLAGRRAFSSLATFCWSSPQTILFGAFDDEAERRSQIYERRTDGDDNSAKPIKLIADGYAPVASPDNRWIAFLRASEGDKSFGVFLFNRATQKVTSAGISFALQDFYLKDVALCWTPDAKKLVVMQSHLKSGRTDESQLDGRISTQIVEMNPTHKVTKLPVFATKSSLPITARQIVGDGRTLILQSSDVVADQTTGNKMLLQAMLGMDLSSGAVETLIKFAPVLAGNPTMRGWDWIESP